MVAEFIIMDDGRELIVTEKRIVELLDARKVFVCTEPHWDQKPNQRFYHLATGTKWSDLVDGGSDG